MVIDAVEADDAVALVVVVDDRAPGALADAAGAPTTPDGAGAGHDGEVLIAEEEPPDGAGPAQALDGHHRVHDRLREGDAAALVAGVERDVLVVR